MLMGGGLWLLRRTVLVLVQEHMGNVEALLVRDACIFVGLS
jgi:hypothetical protein